ncbi:MAG: type VI secretion system-associated protein TagF [Gammaproteobacteria bacterium]
MTPGFYGKLPSIGDFISRRLPQEFTEPWDAWLQGAIAASRDQLGDDWLDAYLTSPIWRFVLSAAGSDECGWAGVLVPSVDRVGRNFPMTIAAPIEALANPFEVANANGGWFRRTEALLLDALDSEEVDLDAFDADVEALGPCQVPEPEPGLSVPGDAGPPWRIALSGVENVGASFLPVLGALIARSLPGVGLWWTSGCERVTPSLLLCERFPEGDQFTAMLDGHWQAWAWNDWAADAGGDTGWIQE